MALVKYCPRPFPAKAVANWFLNQPGTLNPMKIQKLVYFAHGWELGLKHRALLNEIIEAWQYGPVVPSLYHELKMYGSGIISEPIVSLNDRGRLIVPTIAPHDDVQPLLAKVWEVYGHRTGGQLSAMTHIPGSPWHTTWTTSPGVRGLNIPNDTIEKWFSDLAARDAAQ